ncbi:Cytidylate kinase [bioreactor metagenome]|uniref:(d)CMP kinase n=1 Tax=bioreactor metagenome TaxID=1076179 RepID=A0A644X7F1_9ZZZZ|nr:(d)CMP kinase [Candidatus Metalachnospira sp.]
MKVFSIAIDGPAGSGKSTVAKILSDKLGIIYVDTGAMYRTVAFYCFKNGVSTKDGEAVGTALKNIRMDIKMTDGVQRMILNGEDVTGLIRTAEIGQGASDVGVFIPVRDKLVEMQQEIAKKASVVMDGRDIGTVVLPDAKVKIYLNADVEERAKRRLKDFAAQGKTDTLEEVIEQIKIRDNNDMTREYNPLKKAEDAIEIDTTGMTIDEVVNGVLDIVETKTGER